MLTLPNSLVSYGDKCLYFGGVAAALGSLTMPLVPDPNVTFRSLTTIRDWRDDGHTDREHINLSGYPNDVHITRGCGAGGYELQNAAFHRLTAQKITLAPRISRLNGSTFKECWFAKEVDMGALYTMRDQEFRWCHYLTNLDIQVGGEVGDFTFHSIYCLRQIKFARGVTALGGDCLSWNHQLRTVMIPQTVRSIGQYCFYNDNALDKIIVPVDPLVDPDGSATDAWLESVLYPRLDEAGIDRSVVSKFVRNYGDDIANWYYPE